MRIYICSRLWFVFVCQEGSLVHLICYLCLFVCCCCCCCGFCLFVFVCLLKTSMQTPNMHVLSSELISTWQAMFSRWASIANLHIEFPCYAQVDREGLQEGDPQLSQIHRFTHFHSASMRGLHMLRAFLCYFIGLYICFRRHLARHLANMLCAGGRRWLRRRSLCRQACAIFWTEGALNKQTHKL
jgi:hypothetical protein